MAGSIPALRFIKGKTMSEDTKRIIEIGGVKLEVDLRDAKVIENYKVGTKVKILIKEYDSYKPYPGIIVGFDEFEKLPTIKVAYLNTGYSDASIKFAFINEESLKEKFELCPIGDYDFELTTEYVNEVWSRKIDKLKKELAEAEQERDVFHKMFGTIFADWQNNLEKLTTII